jgi:hypothetical protein
VLSAALANGLHAGLRERRTAITGEQSRLEKRMVNAGSTRLSIRLDPLTAVLHRS